MDWFYWTFYVVCLHSMWFYLCVGSVFGLFSCVVWSLLEMLGGWLDSFHSLVASLHGVLPARSLFRARSCWGGGG